MLCLSEIYKAKSGLSQRDLSKLTKMSLGAVNSVLADIKQKSLADSLNGKLSITDKGIEYLSHFKVNNAIIMAAGFGSRFAPLTYETPKGLLNVRGEPLIERQIRQLKESGINEIILIVGYMREKFEYLASKFGVKLVYNKDYATKNNISSLNYAMPYLKSSYILCADNWLDNNIFKEFEPNSWYAVRYFEGNTTEWCVKLRGNKISTIEVGGADSYALYGPAYFSASFSEKFKELIKDYYDKPQSATWYWEDLWMRNMSKLPMYANIRDDVHEFVSISDLWIFDKSYEWHYKKSDDFLIELAGAVIPNEQQAAKKTLKCIIEYLGEEKFAKLLSENGVAVKNEMSMTNVAYKILWKGDDYMLRIPGRGTEKYISREKEIYFNEIGVKLGICPPTDFYDNGNIKLAKYINCHTFDLKRDSVAKAVELISSFHKGDESVPLGLARKFKRNLINEVVHYEAMFDTNVIDLPKDYERLKNAVMSKLYDGDGNALYKVEMCHGDTYTGNILVSDEHEGPEMYLIDYEYSGFLSKYWDYGNFITEQVFDGADRSELIRQVLEADRSLCEDSLLMWNYVVEFVWACWGYAVTSVGGDYAAYAIKRFNTAKEFFIND